MHSGLNLMNLVLILLMALAGASLAGALLFLYRWLVRRRLFPQLPRIWGVDRLRFIILGAIFIALSVGWLVMALVSRPPESAPAPMAGAGAPAGKRAPAAPAPENGEEKYFPLPHRAPAGGDERALPPGPERPLPAPETSGGAPAWATVTSLTTESTVSTSATTTSASATTTAAPTISLTTTQTTAAPTTAAPTTSVTTTLTTASTTTILAPAKAKPAAAGAAVYTACLGSHKQEASAKSHLARLAAQGVKAEAVAVDLGAKGRWWRVYAGEFPDPAAALAQAKEWEKQGLATTPFPVRRR